MKKRKWLGSLLNFLAPGLGAIYVRQVKKGILTYILFFGVVFSLRFVAFNFTLFVIYITSVLGFYLYLVISGYRCVQRDLEYKPAPFDRWYTYIVLLAFHWTLVSSIEWKAIDRLTPISFASIPTSAMDPTLKVGDILAFKRTKAIERYNVAIFWYPDDLEIMYVKRCIGLPGDSLEILEGTVQVNGSPLKGDYLKFKYLVTTEGPRVDPRVLENIDIREHDYFQVSPDSYYFFLTEKQAKELREYPFFRNVQPSIAIEGEPEPMIYPKFAELNWNTDFYGPIYIPRMGDTVEMTDYNIDLYLKCIEFENKFVERNNSELLINGRTISKYVFKENYYFMMGDNRHQTLDSRFWGLLPQQLVIGKAMYLYWGRTSDRIGREFE